MHELPVTESLLEIATRHASTAGASRIISLNIVIGQYASVIDDSIEFYWDIISEGTPANGAKLNFKRIQAEFQCTECMTQFSPGYDLYTCPNCGSSRLNLLAGNEFYLESIEIE